MKTANLLIFSGCLDSIYFLYKLLQEEKDVFLLHVILKKT